MRNLKQAIERVKRILAERQKIKGLLEQAIAAKPTIASRVQERQEALAEAEADAILSGGTVDSSLHTGLTDARAASEAMDARIAGLQGRLDKQGDELLAARDELRTQSAILADEQLKEYDEEFARHANALLQCARRGDAVADCLGLMSSFREIKIVSPLSGREFKPELVLQDGQWVMPPVSAGAKLEQLRDVSYAIEAATRQIEAERRERPKTEPQRPSQAVQPGIMPPHRGPVEEPPIYGRDMIGRATLS